MTAQPISLRPTLRFVAVATLLTDAFVHAALAQEHFSESPYFGWGFVLAAVLQIALAGALALRDSKLSYVAASAVSIGLIAAYAAHVTVGVPTGVDPHSHAAELPTAHQHASIFDESTPHVDNPEISLEPVSPIGIASKALEAGTLLSAALFFAAVPVRRPVRRLALSRIALTGLLLLALPACTSSTGAAAPAAKNEKAVSIKQFKFDPGTLSVPVGTKVTWNNGDAIVHSITGGVDGAPTGAFDSGFFDQGKTFSFTFDKPGEYPYYCMRHVFMMGTVTVMP